MFRAIRSLGVSKRIFSFSIPRSGWSYDALQVARPFSRSIEEGIRKEGLNEDLSFPNKRKESAKIPSSITLESSMDYISEQSTRKVDQILLELAKSPKSFDNLQSTITLLQILTKKNMTVFVNRGIEAFIDSLLRNIHIRTLPDSLILELLVACMQTGMVYHNLPPTEQSIVRELIGGISHEFIVKDFSTYCEYFYMLGKMFFPWRILPIEKRKELLSCLKRFGEVEDGEVGRSRGRLIYGVDQLVILKQSIEDMDEGVRECYERLLMRELEGRYSERGSREMSGEEERIPIVYAILSQLRTLGKLRGKERLSERLLDLIYKGLKEEWQLKEMKIYYQTMVILSLGEMDVDYRSLPKDLWSMMMDDLRNKMQNRIKPVSLSSLCKGWKSMGYKYIDMEGELKEAVLRAVVDLCQDPREARQIANVILYLGGMKVIWEKDMLYNQKDILEGIAKASKSFNAQELSNTLLGLSNMKASWKGMSGEVQNSFLVAIEATCKDMNQQGISNTLYSLGQLGLTWEDVPSSLQEKLLDHLYHLLHSENFIFIDLNGCVTGLKNMGYNWKNGEKLYEKIVKKMRFHANKAKPTKQ